MAIFNKKISKEIADLGDNLKKVNNDMETLVVETAISSTSMLKEEEWVWVEGYKGTNEDMTCQGFQYEIGKEYSLPEGIEPVLCTTGFHLCFKLGDVFNYYEIGYNHRFFKVKALVHKEAVKARTSEGIVWWPYNTDKVVAKSIIFIEELSIDEIFNYTAISDLPLEYKEFALKNGTEKAEKKFVKDRLTPAYGDKLTYYIVEKKGLYASELADALADNNDLTLYEKLSLIFGINSAD